MSTQHQQPQTTRASEEEEVHKLHDGTSFWGARGILAEPGPQQSDRTARCEGHPPNPRRARAGCVASGEQVDSSTLASRSLGRSRATAPRGARDTLPTLGVPVLAVWRRESRWTPPLLPSSHDLPCRRIWWVDDVLKSVEWVQLSNLQGKTHCWNQTYSQDRGHEGHRGRGALLAHGNHVSRKTPLHFRQGEGATASGGRHANTGQR